MGCDIAMAYPGMESFATGRATRAVQLAYSDVAIVTVAISTVAIASFLNTAAATTRWLPLLLTTE